MSSKWCLIPQIRNTPPPLERIITSTRDMTLEGMGAVHCNVQCLKIDGIARSRTGHASSTGSQCTKRVLHTRSSIPSPLSWPLLHDRPPDHNHISSPGTCRVHADEALTASPTSSPCRLHVDIKHALGRGSQLAGCCCTCRAFAAFAQHATRTGALLCVPTALEEDGGLD